MLSVHQPEHLTKGHPSRERQVVRELNQHDYAFEGCSQTGSNMSDSSALVAYRIALTAQPSRLLFSLLMAAIVSAAFAASPEVS